MFKTYTFPSVFEGNNTDLKNVSPDLINGLKIFHNKEGYVIGNLALTEGVSPHRNINSAPDELDYHILLKAALLIANQKLGNPITITTGFPFSTFQLYKETASNLISGQHIVEYDAATFGGGVKKNVQVEVDNVQVIPEVIGCTIAIRKGPMKVQGNFFVISLGYGTLEGLLSTEGGIVQRTSLSTYGLRYAVNLLEKELGKEHYLELKTEHQIDAAFQKGVIFLNRKRIDIRSVRDRVLKQYYEDVISPAMRKAFNDNDFTASQNMYLAGGGATYSALVDCFKEEFKDVLDLEVAHEPQSLASRGYCINSAQLNGGVKSTAVGLDIGNATTVVSIFDDNNNEVQSSSIPSEY
jgi:plasmid segregation protein ParM